MQTASTNVGGKNEDDDDYSYNYDNADNDYDFDDTDEDDADTDDNYTQADDDTNDDITVASNGVAATRSAGDDEYEADDDDEIDDNDEYSYSGDSYNYGSGANSLNNDDSEAPKGHRINSGKFSFSTTFEKTSAGKVTKRNNRAYGVEYNVGNGSASAGANSTVAKTDRTTSRSFSVSGDNTAEKKGLGLASAYQQTDEKGNITKQNDRTYDIGYTNTDEEGLTLGATAITNNGNVRTTRRVQLSGDLNNENSHIGAEQQFIKTDADGNVIKQNDHTYGAALDLGDNGGTVKVDASTVNTETGNTDFSFTASGNVDGENNAFSVDKKSLKTNTDGEEIKHDYTYGAALNLGDNVGTVKVDAATVNTETGNTDFSFTASGNVDGENNAFSVDKKSLKTNTDGEEIKHDYTYGAALNLGDNGGEIKAQSNVTSSEGSKTRNLNISGTLDGEDSEFALNSSAQTTNSDGEVTYNNTTEITTDYNGAEGASFAYAKKNDTTSKTVDIGYTNEEDNKQVLYKTDNVVDGARQSGNTVDIAYNKQGGNLTLQHDAGNTGIGLDLQAHSAEGDANVSFTTNRTSVNSEGNIEKKGSSTELKKESETYAANNTAFKDDHSVNRSANVSLDNNFLQSGLVITDKQNEQTEEKVNITADKVYNNLTDEITNHIGIDVKSVIGPYITIDTASVEEKNKQALAETMKSDAAKAGQIMDGMEADGNTQNNDNQQQIKDHLKSQMVSDTAKAGQIMDGMEADGNTQSNDNQQQAGKDDLKSKMTSDAARAGQTTDAGAQQQQTAPSKEAAQNTGAENAQQQVQHAMVQKKANSR